MELNPGQLQRIDAARNRPLGRGERPQYPVTNLARDAPPFSPRRLPPPSMQPRFPSPALRAPGSPEKPCTRGGGGRRLAHKPMHFAPNFPSRWRPLPGLGIQGASSLQAAANHPLLLNLRNVPGSSDLPFARGQGWAQSPRLVPTLYPVLGAAPGADLPRGAGPGPGRAGAHGAGARSSDYAPQPLASGVRVSLSPSLALPSSLPRSGSGGVTAPTVTVQYSQSPV